MRFRKRVRRILLPMLLLLLLAVPVRAECSHEYVEKRQEPTCDLPGMRWDECIRCGKITGYAQIPSLGHTFGDWYVLTDPTCSREGVQARDCVACGFREEAPIDHVGHEYVIEVEEPTCTARGFTLHYCSGCGDRFRTDYTDPLGHRYDEGVIIKEPTLTAMGRILYSCIGCNETYQEMIPKLTNPFEDIDERAYYFAPVIWAVNSGITSGMDETHFDPDRVCSRAHVVTFLWRAAGKPESSIQNPFADVPADAFYSQAVLWAYETGITTGTDDVHFSPEAPCTRGQVVTFLHRFRCCPESTVHTAFPDVAAGSYYHKAVLWAAERGITVGMDGGRFCPELPCSRAQVVTFLCRDEKNP